MEVGDSTPQELDTHTKLILPRAVEGPGWNLLIGIYILRHQMEECETCVWRRWECVRKREHPSQRCQSYLLRPGRRSEGHSVFKKGMDGWMEKRGEEEAQKKRSWVVEGDYKCCQGCAGRRVWHGQRVTGGVFFPTNIWAPQPSKQLMLNMTHLPPFLSPSQPPISGKHHWAETCSFSEPSSVSGSADGLRMNRFTTRRKR